MNDMKLLASYKNGNYTVRLYEDGTKVKRTAHDRFIADFPDSIDLKITDYCDRGCPMCHERSGIHGAAGVLDAPFLYTLTPGTELAIGGGNPLSHPDLCDFLLRMRRQGVICNLTVNAAHLSSSRALIEELIARRLIHGLGISLTEYDAEAVKFASTYKNAVLHLICGVFCDLDSLCDRGVKVLFLGYKRFGRGEDFYSAEIDAQITRLRERLPSLIGRLDCISFDNLALEQLGVRSLISPADFERMYMGDDGDASMYVDLVRRECARSSTSTERYPLMSNIRDMLARVRK